MSEQLTALSYPGPRSFRDMRGVRRELWRLYRETKSGLVEPALAGRLVQILSAMMTLENGVLLEQRLTELEARLAAVKARPNGHDRRPEMRQ